MFIHSLIIATRFVWKTIPSEARVTRDEVSGLRMKRKQLSGRQYLNEVDVNSNSEYYRQGTVFQTAVLLIFINSETSSRVTLALFGIGFQPNLAGFL